jgi:hypothetical protein
MLDWLYVSMTNPVLQRRRIVRDIGPGSQAADDCARIEVVSPFLVVFLVALMAPGRQAWP